MSKIGNLFRQIWEEDKEFLAKYAEYKLQYGIH